MAKPEARSGNAARKPARPVPSWDEVQTKFAAEQNFGHAKVGDYFPLGRVLRLQHVGPYGFVEYVAPGEPSYHRVYVGGKDTGISRHQLDSAMIAAIAFTCSPESVDYREGLTAAACRALQRHNI